jgi:hypothetical protein
MRRITACKKIFRQEIMCDATQLGFCTSNIASILSPSSTIECPLSYLPPPPPAFPVGATQLFVVGASSPPGWIKGDGATYPLPSNPQLSALQVFLGQTGPNVVIPTIAGAPAGCAYYIKY